MAKEVTKRSENYSQWYNDLALKADLAEQSAVRGCMVIKPYGYAIWEKMQSTLDGMFKKTTFLAQVISTAARCFQESDFLNVLKKVFDSFTFGVK